MSARMALAAAQYEAFAVALRTLMPLKVSREKLACECPEFVINFV